MYKKQEKWLMIVCVVVAIIMMLSIVEKLFAG